ncbi:type 12 methyltransferase [Flammeovirgaceae bacterium 311]|nr:type 12 methyltransferase [Flammeovirgaceae bacterium 311]
MFITCKDYNVSGEKFGIQQCQNCDLLFTNPRPAETELGSYYDSDTYVSHTNKGNTLINRAYKLVRRFTLRQKTALVEKWSLSGELLDIGCGTGHFLQAAKEKGWKVEGVEINDGARTQAEAALEQELYKHLTEIPLTRRFQAISMWHVLEHVYDLGQTLTLLKDLLHKQGSLLIAVPNPQSYDAQVYGSAWAAWDVPRHLYHFSQEVMHKLARKHGFTIKAINPMYFDAFYVSMLSEEYKKGSKAYGNAVITGMRSNLWAKNHNNQFSSLIYILQHA